MNNLAWYSIIITQIIAESLPISSSGHIALVSMILGLSFYTMIPAASVNASWFAQQLMVRSVDHFLHGPTCVIVALFFYNRWMGLLKYWRKTMPIIKKLILYVGIADLITGFFFITLRCMPVYCFPLGFGFAFTAILLASLAWCKKEGESLTGSKMIVLGIVQGLALLPGVSRFASTYVAARWLSLSPRHALETAWMIQVPLMIVSFLHSLIIFWQIGIPDQVLNMETAFVMMVASIGGWYALRFAAYASARNKMWWFACYMAVPLMLWVIYK
jgi:undecaprenyl-diphosphatase